MTLEPADIHCTQILEEPERRLVGAFDLSEGHYGLARGSRLYVLQGALDQLPPDALAPVRRCDREQSPIHRVDGLAGERHARRRQRVGAYDCAAILYRKEFGWCKSLERIGNAPAPIAQAGAAELHRLEEVDKSGPGFVDSLDAPA